MRFAPAALAALVAVAPVEDGKPSLEERLFRAFYQENGIRDFEKASALYAELVDAARAAKDAGIEAKALLGRARCLKVRGKKDEAEEAVRAVLVLEPGNQEAAGLRASLAGATVPTGEDGALAERCNVLLDWLAGQAVDQARREFSLLGARGLPALERALRSRALEYVEGAGGLLASGGIPGGLEALERGIADPDVVYSRALCEAILAPLDATGNGRSSTPRDLPLLEAVARRKEADLRVAVVQRLCENDLGAEPRALSLVKALAADPAEEVRLSVLERDWYASYWKVVAPLVTAALRSAAPAERAAAALSIKQDADLLRTVAGEVRGLLKDPDAAVRTAAFTTLMEMDGLGQADLAGLLTDPDGGLVAAAAERLRSVSPWEKGVAEAVRDSLKRVLRAEVPSSGTEGVLAFVGADPRPGGLTLDDLVSLFAQSWAPEQRLGTRAASEVRGRILDAIGNRFGSEEESRRHILRGMKAIPSPDGVLQWLVRWTQENGYRSAEVGIAAASSGDPRIRAAGYLCLSQCPAASDAAAVTASLRHLSEDLLGEDPDLQAAAMAVATVYPDPVSVEAIRKHHAAAEGPQRASLLHTLVQAVGKAAEPEVRADLASKDSGVRYTALWALVGSLGYADYGEIQGFLKGGGTPREVASLWTAGYHPRPPIALLRSFLAELPPAKADDLVLRAASLLPVEERNEYLKGALRNPNASMRAHAANLVASWRAMDCVSILSTLLDDPDAGVQNAAASALEQLNKYLERKAAAARLLDGPAVDPLDAAKALLRSPDAAKRRGAVLALGALQDKGAISLLLKALEDAEPSVRDAALQVLDRLGAPK